MKTLFFSLVLAIFFSSCSKTSNQLECVCNNANGSFPAFIVAPNSGDPNGECKQYYADHYFNDSLNTNCAIQ